MTAIPKGSSDVSIEVFAVDALTGQPLAGLAAGDVTARYVRSQSAPVTASPVVLGAVDAAHADGGFVALDATHAVGWYRFDVPDAAWASGADAVLIVLQADDALISAFRAELTSASDEIAEEIHLCKAALVNRRLHTVSTGVDEILDDDGSTTLVTLTPTGVSGDTIAIEPS